MTLSVSTMIQRPSAKALNGSIQTKNYQKSRLKKSKVKTMLICFYDSEGKVHKEFVRTGETVNGVFYVGVMKRLLLRIRRVRSQYRENGSWHLLHDNAPSHRSNLTTDFLTKMAF